MRPAACRTAQSAKPNLAAVKTLAKNKRKHSYLPVRVDDKADTVATALTTVLIVEHDSEEATDELSDANLLRRRRRGATTLERAVARPCTERSRQYSSAQSHRSASFGFEGFRNHKRPSGNSTDKAW